MKAFWIRLVLTETCRCDLELGRWGFGKLTGDNELARAVLKWSSHPVKKKASVSVLVVVFLLVVWWVVYVSTSSVFLTGLSVVIMLVSLSSFFLPTHYELDQRKVRIQYLLTRREREWGAFRSFYVDKNGVLLSPFPKPSRLENFRGVYVRFNRNKDQVVDFVKSKIQRHESVPDEQKR